MTHDAFPFSDGDDAPELVAVVRPRNRNTRSTKSELPPSWHMEARRLRAEPLKMGFAAIAKAVHRSESTVREFFDENGEKQRKKEREATFRTGGTVAGKVFTGREPRKVLVDPETKNKALALFAAGKIDREALMRVITVGRPDTSAELAQRAGTR